MLEERVAIVGSLRPLQLGMPAWSFREGSSSSLTLLTRQLSIDSWHYVYVPWFRASWHEFRMWAVVGFGELQSGHEQHKQLAISPELSIPQPSLLWVQPHYSSRKSLIWTWLAKFAPIIKEKKQSWQRKSFIGLVPDNELKHWYVGKVSDFLLYTLIFQSCVSLLEFIVRN